MTDDFDDSRDKAETPDSRLSQEIVKRLDQLDGRLNELQQLFHKHKHRVPEQPPLSEPRRISPQKPPEKPVEVKSVPAKEEVLPRRPLSVSQAVSFEQQVGARWLNRVGVIAIVIAVGFFLKYAFENRWIGEIGRVVLGLLTGVIMLVLGEWAQKKKYYWFGQGVTGAGIAILYLCIFASFNFYHLIPEVLAILLILTVTVGAVALSLRYNVMAIAVLAVLGGFITPYLLETGAPKPVPVFTYILVIDLGVLAIAYFRNWRALNIITFVLTVIAFWGWYESCYNLSYFRPAFSFAAAFFIIFASLGVIHNIVNRKRMDSGDFLLIIAIPLLFFAFCFDLLMPGSRDSLVMTTIALALFYFVIGTTAIRRNPHDRYLSLTLFAVALAFIIIVIPLRLKQHWITIGWIIEACVLTTVGFRMKDWRVRRAGIVLLLLGFFRAVFYDSHLIEYGGRHLFLYSERSISLVVVIVGAFLTAWVYQNKRGELEDSEEGLSTFFSLTGSFLLLWMLSAETIDFYRAKMGAATGPGHRELRYAQQLSLSCLWSLFAIALVIIGIAKRNLAIRITAIFLFTVTVFKVFIVDLAMLKRIYRILSFLGLGVILLIVSYLYHRFRDRLGGGVQEGQ